jgi:hypothetical protein
VATQRIDDDTARAELADLRRRLALARGDEEAEIARMRKDLKRIEGNLRRFANRRWTPLENKDS